MTIVEKRTQSEQRRDVMQYGMCETCNKVNCHLSLDKVLWNAANKA